MALPNWSLAVAYWLHMLATIVWIGGLAALAMFVLPAARKTLEPVPYANFLLKAQVRLQQAGWLCLAVLTGTGLFQMSAHPSYLGVLSIGNAWSMAILAKHAVIGLMIGVSAALTWGITPRLQRLAMVRAAGAAIDDRKQMELLRVETRLMRVNLIFSVLVLLLTALARSS